jgi:hypothetical protein
VNSLRAGTQPSDNLGNLNVVDVPSRLSTSASNMNELGPAVDKANNRLHASLKFGNCWGNRLDWDATQLPLNFLDFSF